MLSVNPYISEPVDLSQPFDTSASDPPPLYNPNYDEPPEHPHPDDFTDLPKGTIIDKLRGAILKSQIELVHLILDTYSPSVFSVNDTHANGQTFLCAALNTGQNNLARELIVKYGADVEAWSREGMDELQRPIMRTPLMVACSLGNYAAVKMLMEEFGADEAVIGKDGMIALRCAVLAAREGKGEAAKCVEYLPARRSGGWRRFKHKHDVTMKAVRKTTSTIQAVGKFFFYSVPKFFFWTFPKWLGKKVKNACVHTYHATIHFFNDVLPKALKVTMNGIGKLANVMGKFIASIPSRLIDLINYLVFKAPVVIYRMCKTLATEILPKLAVDTWNGVIKVSTAVGKATAQVAVWTWTLCTRRIPIWTWKLLKWLFNWTKNIITVRIPALLKELGELLKRGMIQSFNVVVGLFAKLASAIHTAVAFFISRLGKVTVKDIVNSLTGLLHYILVTIPVTIFTGLGKGFEFLVDAIPRLFGVLGKVAVTFFGLLAAIIGFIPYQIAKLLWEFAKWIGRGIGEIWLWINPKSSLGSA